MNVFTTNQANQVYVANAYKASAVAKTDALGTLTVGTDATGGSIYVQQLGAGGLTRSDLIDVKNILYCKNTPASAMARPLKVATVTLNSDLLSNSALTTTGEYILRIRFDQAISLSPENQYWKYGAVHGVAGMTASNFYKKLALSVAKNMSREAVHLVKVELKTSSTNVEVTSTTKESALTGTYTGVVITEVEQDWILGVKQQRPVSFFVEPTTIEFNDVDFVWGEVAYSDGAKIGNGKLVADYEYFYMGERGDQYRLSGFPNYIPTKYLVDPTKTYDIISIHYAYVGENHAAQKSEKDLTILVPTDASGVTASIVSAINTAAGTTVIPVSNAAAGTDNTDEGGDAGTSGKG